eukprot:gene351-6765_t
MGNSIAQSMAENQKIVMREMQEEQLGKMWDQMVRGQERMRRLQMSMAIAMTKERLNWMGGVYGLFTCGLTIRVLKKQPVPPIVIVPMILGGALIGYQADLAYGNKANRINKMTEEIMKNEDYWY